VVADWLEENGDANDRKWAELVRLECQLSRLPDDAPQRRGLERRVYEIREDEAEGLKWEMPWPDGTRFKESVRGLIRLEAQPATAFLEAEDEVSASEGYAWVDGLLIVNLSPKDVPYLADSRLVEGLNFLHLFSHGIWDEGARWVASS